MTEDVTFGRWLRQRRRRLDLTQEALAARVGYALPTIRRVEADDLRPSRELAEKLAEALALAPDERPVFVRFARGERDAYLPLPAVPVTPVPVPPSLPRHNLPAQPTPLIGRETEIQSICDRLSQPDVRLLTLTGPGGVGKTRVALQAAAEWLDTAPDGVWFVPLAPIRDPNLVAPAIARELEMADSGDVPLVERLKRYLHPKQTLLVLDNFEQVTEAAALVADLLAAAPDLKVLVTSREPLRVSGEMVWPISPLLSPAPDNKTEGASWAIRKRQLTTETSLPSQPALPTGTLTLLFTDIEGSTRLWETYPAGMARALARHDAILRQAIEARGGYVFKTVGDAFCAAFATALDALMAALDVQRGLASAAWTETEPFRVRMALHTGTAEERDGDLFGPALNRVARLLSAGYGGQVLLSQAAYELVRDHLPVDVSLRDLGEHRLRDLTRPERVYQLVTPDLTHDFPQLKTLDRHPHNLPLQPTPLIGREREIETLGQLVRRDDARLVTLTGPGGTGKTRLSLQAAAELLDYFRDGCYFVALTTDNPELVVSTIGRALGIQDQPTQTPLATLTEWLRDKQMLLVLDNFEQVVAAAPLVSELLAAAPQLKALVTSRVPLRLQGEREYPVPPLALPPSEDRRRRTDAEPTTDYASRITQYEAVRLFIERARAVKPDFAVTNETAPAVAEICCRLDGLPLAIELAAARIRVLPPKALLARLDQRLKVLVGGSRDLPARQQTLRDTIAWSYNLLNAGEQRLFWRLAVFVGGWTLEAAEAVCNADGALVMDVLDGMESLVAKSLVQQREGSDGEPRFTMLETVREYALERLAESGEIEAVRRRHAKFFLELAETTEPKLCSADQVEWLKRLESDYDNLRAALVWCRGETSDSEMALKLAGALWGFWFWRGDLTEGYGWLRDALTKTNPSHRTAARAKALCGAGALAWGLGDLLAARDWLEESVAICRDLGTQPLLAASLHYLGHVILETDRAAARVLFEESVSLCRATGDQWTLALTLCCMGGAVVISDHQLARALYEESLSLWRASRDKAKLAIPLAELGRVALEDGNYTTARRLFEEGLAIHREMGLKWQTAEVLDNLGDVARCLGEYEQARLLYEESLVLWRNMSNTGGAALSLSNLGHVALAQRDYERAEALFKESLSLTPTLSKGAVARALAGFARLAAGLEQPRRAARLIGAVDALLATTGGRLDPADRLVYDRTVSGVRVQLDANAWLAAVAEGGAMTLEQVIALAMEQPECT